MRVIRRVLFLVVLGAGLGLAVLRVASVRAGVAARRRDDTPPDGMMLTDAAARPPAVVPAASPADAVVWVAPIDGACPDGYPVKVKASSGIFHVPGGRSYERTSPDRCYATPAAAEADGYRPSKA